MLFTFVRPRVFLGNHSHRKVEAEPATYKRLSSHPQLAGRALGRAGTRSLPLPTRPPGRRDRSRQGPSDRHLRRAASKTFFRSATPENTAEICSKCSAVASASSRATVVLQVPGGPQNTSEPSVRVSSMRVSAPSGPSRWSCPTTSDSAAGRNLSASGRGASASSRAAANSPGGSRLVRFTITRSS